MSIRRIAISILFTFICAGISIAQSGSEIKGGVIKYEAFDKFDLSYFKDADPKVKEWLAGMPKGSKSARVLYFNKNYSLFEQDNSAQAAVVDEKVLVMRSKLPYITAPRPELKKVFINNEKGVLFKQMELMTRFFIIEDGIKEWNWKPGSEQVKILGYLCMSAKANSGDKIITAWFTPEIQSQIGPGLYHGLPGLILAVDINGENIFLATEVDLKPPDDEIFRKPSEGKNMKSEEFQILVDEKIEQYRAEMENEKKVDKFLP